MSRTRCGILVPLRRAGIPVTFKQQPGRRICEAILRIASRPGEQSSFRFSLTPATPASPCPPYAASPSGPRRRRTAPPCRRSPRAVSAPDRPGCYPSAGRLPPWRAAAACAPVARHGFCSRVPRPLAIARRTFRQDGVAARTICCAWSPIAHWRSKTVWQARPVRRNLFTISTGVASWSWE